MTDLENGIVQDLARAAAEDALAAIVRKTRLATSDLQMPIVATALSMIEVKRRAMIAGVGGGFGDALAELCEAIMDERLAPETATLRDGLSRAGVA